MMHATIALISEQLKSIWGSKVNNTLTVHFSGQYPSLLFGRLRLLFSGAPEVMSSILDICKQWSFSSDETLARGGMMLRELCFLLEEVMNRHKVRQEGKLFKPSLDWLPSASLNQSHLEQLKNLHVNGLQAIIIFDIDLVSFIAREEPHIFNAEKVIAFFREMQKYASAESSRMRGQGWWVEVDATLVNESYYIWKR
jgi:hypothetical protein